jgi:4-aminobutyrate aminotransferase-like enzyme
VGQRIESALTSCTHVQAIRRKGLYIAVELDSSERVNRVIDACLRQGVLIFFFLSTPHAFRIAPPLNIDEADVEEALEVLIKCIQAS